MDTSPPIQPTAATDAAPASETWYRDKSVLYPDRYAWYILASVMDITCTVTVLIHYGAREVNSIAQASIELFGTWGLIGLKFLTLVIVILICEYIGRKSERLGRTLATLAIVASLMPVIAATSQVFYLWGTGDLQHTPWPRPLTPSDEEPLD